MSTAEPLSLLPVLRDPTAMPLGDRRFIPISVRRWRGSYPSTNTFAIYSDAYDSTAWCIVPTNYAESLEDLIQSLPISSCAVLAGGRLTADHLDFTFAQTQPQALRELIVRGFAPRQRYPECLLQFGDAQVLLEGRPTGWGTILDILRTHGFEGIGLAECGHE